MLKIPRRYSHYVFGVIQSGLTCAVAAAIASYPLMGEGKFVSHWLMSWLIAWLTMLPVVLFAAPYIQKASDALTGGERASRKA
jgi:FtsH-binding integral membrane protein